MKKNGPKLFPLGIRTDPSLDTWKRLFGTVRMFYERRPWDTIGNNEPFSVVDPVSGQTGYCGIMGHGGIEYGMQVYLGDTGLRCFHKIATGETGPDEMIQELRSIGISFGTRDFLDARDIAPIKKLLLPFRGDGWPQFRSYNPGYAPWYITDDEANFLACCMEQAVVVADEAADDPDFVINEGPDGKILVRVPEKSGETLQWKNEYRALIIPGDVVVPEFTADEFSVAALSRKPVAQGTFWEVDSFPMMSPITDSEPPRFPRLFACVESKAGIALGCGLSTPDMDHLKVACDKLAGLLRELPQKPREIHFRRPQLADCMSSFLESIGIKPVLVEKLAILEELEEGMKGCMNSHRIARVPTSPI